VVESRLNNKNQHHNLSFEELVAACDDNKYGNIQIFLSKTCSSCKFGQEFLMVSKSGFSIVRILDVDYKNDKIFVDIEDSNTGTIKHLDFDINDKEFRYLFIAWNDLRQMVYEENASSISNDDLLELEND
jgi:hypothetical protein